MRVLIADDHPLAAAAMRAVLEAEGGFEVVGEARSGSQVLPRARELKPDVVLLDLMLPELDGLACLERLANEFPEVPVVVCSGLAERGDVDAAQERGACAFVTKAGDPGNPPVATRAAAHGAPVAVYGELESPRRPSED